MLRLPIDFVGEYRGQAPGGSFDRDGETIEYLPKLKFEYEDESGDVVLVPIGLQTLDRCEPPFDASKLKKGDHVRITGHVVLQDRGSDRDSYLSIRSAQPCDASGKVKSQPELAAVGS